MFVAQFGMKMCAFQTKFNGFDQMMEFCPNNAWVDVFQIWKFAKVGIPGSFNIVHWGDFISPPGAMRR